MNKVHFSSITDDYRTPESFYNLLNTEFKFADDSCPIKGSNGLERESGIRQYFAIPLTARSNYGFQKHMKSIQRAKLWCY